MIYPIEWCIDQIKKLWVKIASVESSTEADFVHKSGDTMAGPLYLSSNPVTDVQAATKSYVDTNISSSGVISKAFTVAASTWTWDHNSGHKLAGVQAYDASWNLIGTDIVENTDNKVVATHLANITGYLIATR